MQKPIVTFSLALTFLTGITGLCYQVLWQRSLTVLFGADAKSVSLVLAIFLLGLAVGNYFFGIKTVNRSRQKTLRLYGFAEMGIGLWALIFPLLLDLSQSLLGSLPQFFILDLFFAFALIFPPTFLMGSTIPLLTASLPEDSHEVHDFHRTVYAINTIGAFVGVVVGAFLIIPEFGLRFGSNILGLINIVVGLLFSMNKLKGDVLKASDPPKVIHKYNDKEIYLFAFVTGAFTIGCEVLAYRFWAISIGPSVIVFPMVLSLFVLGIGIGTLGLKFTSIKVLRNEILKTSLGLVLFIFSLPFLPLWASHLKVLIDSNLYGFYLFHFLIYLLMSVLILPVIIPLGRLLPLGYSLLEKNNSNFAQVCGRLYTFNTLGTFFGAVLLGHIFFNFFSLTTLLKLNVLILLATFIYFLIKEKNYKSSVLVSFILLFLMLNPLSRRFHYVSLYRTADPIEGIHYKGLLHLPEFSLSSIEPLFLEDDAHNTVAVARTFDVGKSIYVNGKSDSSTLGDLSTLTLISYLPYYFHRDSVHLKTASVGLGTGVSVGIMAELPGVDVVDVAEISSGVINAQEYLKEENFNVALHKKVNIYEVDAFRFFDTRKDYYDIVVSEPTNPWVVGVENLFTDYFYQKVKASLKNNGIFAQWFHVYSMDKANFLKVLSNLKSVFPFVNCYFSNSGDLVFIASSSQLSTLPAKDFRQEDRSYYFMERIDIVESSDIKMLKIFDDFDVRLILMTNEVLEHSIDFPTLALSSYVSFFLNQTVNLNSLVDPFFYRRIYVKRDDEKYQQFKKLYERHQKGEMCSGYKIGTNPLCEKYNFIYSFYTDYLTSKDVFRLVRAYKVLRKELIIDSSSMFLNGLKGQCHKFSGELEIQCLLEIGEEEIKDDLREDFTITIKKLNDLGRGSQVDNLKSLYSKIDGFVLELKKKGLR